MRNACKMVVDYYWTRAMWAETAIEYELMMAHFRAALAEMHCG